MGKHRMTQLLQSERAQMKNFTDSPCVFFSTGKQLCHPLFRKGKSTLFQSTVTTVTIHMLFICFICCLSEYLYMYFIPVKSQCQRRSTKVPRELAAFT